MIYIFDLDGTLIDSSERMYRLFCDLIPECSLTKDEYWNYKRNKINHKKLIEMLYPQVSFEEFNDRWMPLIEEKKYLDMDRNYPDTLDVLSEMKGNGNTLYLLTARQSKKSLMEELQRLDLMFFFNAVITTEGKQSKEDVLIEFARYNQDILNPENIFISDMGKDIQLGNKLGFYTVAISYGFMSEEKLKEYSPKRVIKELSELITLTPTKR